MLEPMEAGHALVSMVEMVALLDKILGQHPRSQSLGVHTVG